MMAEKEVIVQRGPRFFRAEDNPVMFENVIDGGSRIGPRVATEADQKDHAAAFAAFKSVEAEAVNMRGIRAGDNHPKSAGVVGEASQPKHTFREAVEDTFAGKPHPGRPAKADVEKREADRIARDTDQAAGKKWP